MSEEKLSQFESVEDFVQSTEEARRALVQLEKQGLKRSHIVTLVADACQFGGRHRGANKKKLVEEVFTALERIGEEAKK